MGNWRGTISATLLATAPAALLAVMPGVAQAALHRPNILLILTDDQTTDSFAHMPFLQSVQRRSVRFRNYFHTEAVCSPSRASIMTGMYPHNHGVQTGYAQFMANTLAAKSWSKILHNHGYHTAMLGKFQNGYDVTETRPPIGWDDWMVADHHGYRGIQYQMNDNGVTRSFGVSDHNYLTNVIKNRAVKIIRQQHAAGKPFAMMFAPFCPHTPSRPANRYLGTASGERARLTDKKNFNEADVSDKPTFIQALPQLSAAIIDNRVNLWRRRVECNRSTDDALRLMWDTLDRLGELDNTYIFVLTDNGFLLGEHRIDHGKLVPYVEAIRGPLYVFGPRVRRGARRQMIANIDIMPTILDLARIDPSARSWIDGRSFKTLLRRTRARWRHSLLVTGWPTGTPVGPGYSLRNFFKTLVTGRQIFTRYDNGEHEFYDLAADPLQIDNGYSSLDPAAAQAMQDRLDDLSTCAGQDCRDKEDQPL